MMQLLKKFFPSWQWRFSLAGLFLVVTTICVVGGFFARYRQRAQVVAVLKSQGYQVFYAGKNLPSTAFSRSPRWKVGLHNAEAKYRDPDIKLPATTENIESITGEYGFRKLDTVVICGEHHSLSNLERWPLDTSNYFEDHPITRAEFAPVAEIGGLRNLSITTDHTLEHIAPLMARLSRLQVLNLDAPKCVADELAPLLKIRSLETLVLVSIDLTDPWIINAIAGHETLQDLTLMNCKLLPGAQRKLSKRYEFWNYGNSIVSEDL